MRRPDPEKIVFIVIVAIVATGAAVCAFTGVPVWLPH